jgi:(E)-4-hydroxy-3-methylbut-2-enyl-diphosphate synthase
MTPEKNVYTRFKTRVVNIGNLPLGGEFPIRVQSMTNTDTLDTKATVAQVIRLIKSGCEYVRISVPGLKETENLRNIRAELNRKGFHTPLIADIHFNPKLAEIAAAIVEKVRINPGNYVDKKSAGTKRVVTTDKQYREELEKISDRIRPLVRICKDHGTAIRIGANHGSLSDRIIDRFGNTAEGMVESAVEFLKILEDHDFHNTVVAMKASNVRVMIRANRLLVERMQKEGMNYPIHLGVTEAGEGEDGRIKSAIGIGSLLADGIGDTIRVSITEDPVREIPVAYNILQATGVRISKTEYISCPSCARTLFDIRKTLQLIREKTGHLKGMKIAVMGCIVNGPGEMADAHFGYVGAGKGKINLYKGQELVKRNIDEAEAVGELILLIRDSGEWME